MGLSFNFIWRNIWLLLVSVVLLSSSPVSPIGQNSPSNFGLPSWLLLAATVYCFSTLGHSSAMMKWAHRATPNIMAEASKSLYKVMTEEKTREWPNKWPNKGESWTSTPAGGAKNESQITFMPLWNNKTREKKFLFVWSLVGMIRMTDLAEVLHQMPEPGPAW